MKQSWCRPPCSVLSFSPNRRGTSTTLVVLLPVTNYTTALHLIQALVPGVEKIAPLNCASASLRVCRLQIFGSPSRTDRSIIFYGPTGLRKSFSRTDWSTIKENYGQISVLTISKANFWNLLLASGPGAMLQLSSNFWGRRSAKSDRPFLEKADLWSHHHVDSEHCSPLTPVSSPRSVFRNSSRIDWSCSK